MALIRRIGFSRFSRWGDPLGRLAATAATHTEALDGTDELKLTCSEDLSKGERIVWIDWHGACHEHIVDQTARTHDGDGAPATSATCINSVSETWDDWVDDKRPSGDVSVALAAALENTRWQVGTCDQRGSASRTLYHESAREAIADIMETWGGELETTIENDGTRVTSRSVGIRALRGNQSSPKRFTWTKDLLSVKRTVSTDNPKTRVYCYGKGVETESGYGRRLTIADVNGGLDYVEDATATAVWGHPDGKGGTLPAVTSYVNEDCEDAAQLKGEGLAYLEQVKEPKVTYTASVLDLYAFGRSWEGVGVGDSVAIIDKGFSDEGVRLRGRVTQLERDLLTGDATVTFGNLTDAMADMWQGVSSALRTSRARAALYDAVASTSPSWLRELQSALNAEFSSVGTYRVESFELGEIYSNVPLDQATGLPVKSTSGMWAVNINGMGIRLAHGLTSSGEWDWKTFVTGEGAVADLINVGVLKADLIKAGILQDKAGKNYINMETGDSRLSSSTTVVGTSPDGTAYQTTLGDVSQNLAGAMRDIDTITGTDLPLSEVRAVALRAAMQVDTEMVSRMDEYNRIKASDSYKALGQTDRTAFEGAYSAMADAAQEVLDLNTSISKETGAEHVDQMRSALSRAQDTYRDAISDYEKALAPMRLRDYSTTTQMNSAIKKSATELKSTFDKTIESYSTTEQMNSAISQSADGIKSDVSKTYETKASAHARYATCYTAATTQAKVATCSGFELYAGAVVSVYFAYANTVLSPTLNVNGTGAKGINVNGSSTSAAIKWKAYSTITFVYDGGGWRMADAGARSEIRQLADSISLSVTGSLGGTASIKLSADGDTDSETIDLSKVRAAFRDDHSAITISAGTITFNSNTFVVNSTYFKVSSSGVITATSGTIGGFTITSYSIYNDLMSLSSSGLSLDYTVSGSKKDCGNIGTNGWHGDSSKFGLNFDLEYDAWYMTWAYRESPSDSTYTVKWTYASGAFSNFTKNTLNAGCDIDMHGYMLKNAWIDTSTGGANGGISGTLYTGIVKSITDQGNGSIRWTYGSIRMVFKNGILTEAAW